MQQLTRYSSDEQENILHKNVGTGCCFSRKCMFKKKKNILFEIVKNLYPIDFLTTFNENTFIT